MEVLNDLLIACCDSKLFLFQVKIVDCGAEDVAEPFAVDKADAVL